MQICRIRNIEIIYPDCYMDIMHLGVENFRTTTDFFEYDTSMIVFNKALPRTNDHFVFAFYKYWFGGIYVDCFISNGTEYNLDSACNKINYYSNIDISSFIKKIPVPNIDDVVMDDWD